MKGTLLLKTKTFFLSPPHGSGVTQKYHMAPPAHAPQAVQVRFRSVSNEGHATLETERVFPQYLHSHCSGTTEICHMVLSAHALRAVQVTLKSVSNEGHFTLEAGTVFERISPHIAVV
jgi:hypothetical protein